jgi:putative spermidine/putrescine transport system permease protein
MGLRMHEERTSLALRVYVTLLLFFLAAPILLVVFVSFNAGAAVQFPPRGYSLFWYRTLWENDTLLRTSWNSLVLATLSTLISMGLGIPAAIALVRYRFWGREMIQALLLSPLTLPMIVIGLALLFLYGKTGIGLSFFSLLLGHVVITFPYIVRTVAGVYHGVNEQIEEAAMVMGAGPWRTFRHITLPLIRPGLVAGGIFSFITSFDNVPVSIFLTRTETNTLPVYIMSYLVYNFDPSVAAVSSLQLIFAVAVLCILEKTYGLKNISMVGGGR